MTKKIRSISKILGAAAIFLLLVAIVVKLLNLGDFIFGGPKTVVQLITDTGLKSDNGRVNILLLGIGGGGHQGPDLSDTLILASIDKKGTDVALISIPRDLWVPSLSTKINVIYTYGQEQRGGGLILAKKITGQLFDLPIHYAFRIDFAGFTKAIDLIGGIDVDVQNAFVDYQYPIPGREDDTCGLTITTEQADGAQRVVVKDSTGSAMIVTEENDPFTCRYETISFEKGLTPMDGTTALKFVRSRHGTAGEGSDFARSARQQQVILAFRQKVLTLGTFTNPKTIIDLVATFGKSIDTDITNREIPLFVKLGSKIDPASIRRVVLSADLPESVLTVGNSQDYGGQFVLIPKNNNWHDLAEYVQGELFKLNEK